MRSKKDRQGRLEFNSSTLKITNDYYARYESISGILDSTPAILGLVHQDLAKSLDQTNGYNRRRGRPGYTSEQLLRTIVCQSVEGLSLRDIVVRIDDSYFLRRFVKIHGDSMMDYTVLCRLRNQITPKTWAKINLALAKSAYSSEMIGGAKLRLDTTAVETNIHYPTDSSLLWDVYRVNSRLIRRARKIDAEVGRERNLQDKYAKRQQTRIAREARKRSSKTERMKRAYGALFGLVEGVLEMSVTVAQQLRERIRENRYGLTEAISAKAIALEIDHHTVLGDRVLTQAKRRVLDGEKVPTDEKIYSIFEPHTEMLIRGKAGKNIEFGHMVHLQQVEGKFITSYEVFKKRPADNMLVDPSIKNHLKLFGHRPKELATDKGYYESMDKIRELEEEIELVSIAKKGNRTAEETSRESSAEFKLAQAFRAGIEGSISFLKRVLRMARCFVKGYDNYCAEVGRIVFAHNLIVLARGPTA